ncbi:MAG TPA: alanine racemase [Rhizomicrobium sp.]|jgi:alanine racemase|nr:alanine racemase [Rhizomicrobium sp.]
MSIPDWSPGRLSIRLGAIAANYREFRQRSASAEVAGVVKADAYGLGTMRVARTLAEAGCRTFFVARVEEGIALRPVVPNARILVLDGVVAGSTRALIEHRLVPVLNSLAEIESWSQAARAEKRALDCAIHIDTGMNRLGLPPDELAVLVEKTQRRLFGFNVVLCMSHLACADDPASSMNRMQLDRFKGALAQLPPAPASLSASAGVLLGKEYVFDVVRAGIGLYGGHPQITGENPFAVAAVATGRILQIRRVDRGETVGYGATFRVGRPSTLATVGLGYADGLMRAIGNKGQGAIAGMRAPIVGRLSMDVMTLDVTDIRSEAVSVGAEVEFLGDTISLEEFAGWAGTASYEVLTSFGRRLPRYYEPAA